MTEHELELLLSAPRTQTVAALRECPGDVVILGAGGKMGPTLARMVARASADGPTRRIFAVSRFSSDTAARALEDAGIGVVRADLLDRRAVDSLPDADNVIFMAGQKFGTSEAPATTWAMNTVVPVLCAERYRGARIAAFSTGNVYPLTPIRSGGARETDPVGPVGEYAMSCVGRERVFEHAARRYGTRVSILRLNYAIDLRYGVLVDLARRIQHDEAIPLEMGYVNVIWQGDANRIAIESLARAAAPPFVVNLTGRDTCSVRDLAARLGERLGREPRFSGRERNDALLSNTDLMRATFAAPEVGVDQMLDRVAAWVRQGGALLDKPTHFETRDGQF